jgi:hypothetical protein
VAAVNDRERAARADDAGKLFSAWAQARRASMLNVVTTAVCAQLTLKIEQWGIGNANVEDSRKITSFAARGGGARQWNMW